MAKSVKSAENVIKSTVDVPLSTNQKAAVTSLIYNIGSGNFKWSNALKLLNSGDIDGFLQEAFDSQKGFTRFQDQVNAGLVARREEERKLFNS